MAPDASPKITDGAESGAIAAEFPRKLGDFTLQSELGRGGSGVVYAALWGHREVALKVLHPEQAATEKARDQFLLEARRLADLNHPGVVKVLAVGLVEARPYLVMERLPGETLAERLARGPIKLPLALELAQQLADAVAAMHARNLVHRDLKPENVFLVDERHVVLLDFGIAKDLFAAPSTTTQDGGIRGTPAYMAPERFFGQAAGVTTDVYELAVVVYAMIAARLPWESLTDPAARLDPSPLASAEAPAALDTLLRIAMSTRASNRPASVAEFAASLRACIQGADIADGQPHETQPMPAQSTTANQTLRRQANGRQALGQQATEPAHPDAASLPRAGTSNPWFERRPPTATLVKPTEPTLPSTPRRSKRTWLAAATATVAVAGAGGIWWQLRDRPASARGDTAATAVRASTVDMLPPAKDPWGARPPAPAADGSGGSNATLATSGLIASAPQATGNDDASVRAGIAAALTRVPRSAAVVAVVSLVEWRRSQDAMHLTEVALTKPAVAALTSTLPSCAKDLVANATWVVVSSKERGFGDGVVLQVGGVPSDAAITDCLKPANEGQRLDGATTGTWGDLFEGTMLWRDQTLVFSSYPELPAVKLWSNRSITGLTGRLAELYQRILPNPTVALMADLPNKPIIDGIPKGADIVASVSVGDKVEVDFGLETLTVAEAIAFETEGKKQVADMLGASNEIINLGVVRDQKIVRLTGKLPPMILRVVANALTDTK